MERYHILKLGLAITFYAAYCIRPMLVYSLDADNQLDNNPNVQNKADIEYFKYFQGVDGIPGVDFPVYSYIPRTAFNCRGIESGYYADPATDCQVFHICEDGKKISFLCPNGTIFQQSELICEWWNKVNCTNSPNLYEESAERLQNDVARRKASRKVVPLNGAETNHGAIIRTEERSSVRATTNGRGQPARQQKQRQQQIKNHRIPDNNEIEQQIEQAESNNRHLARAHTNLEASLRNNIADQQRRHPNHNYSTAAQGESDRQANRSKQNKKDIDKDTGNYINNNYDQSATRHSKKVEQGLKNNFDFGSKIGQEKSSTLKEYHVQFGSTSSGINSATEDYSAAQTNFLSTQQYGSSSSGFNQNQNENFSKSGSSKSSYSYSTESIAPQNTYGGNLAINKVTSRAQNTFQKNPNNEIFGLKATSNAPQISYNDDNNNAPFNIGVPSSIVSTIAPSDDFLSSSTLPSVPARKTEKPAYGSTIKGKFNSFDGRQPQNEQTSQNNNRGSIKYKTNSNYVITQPISKDSDKVSTPATTYSPPTKYSTFTSPENEDDNFELPPFPKHKSELNHSQGINEVQDQSYVNRIEPQLPFSKGSEPTVLGQIQVNIVQPNQKPIQKQNSIGLQSVIHNTEQTKNHESEESQVTQESSSFVKNSFNSIRDDSFKTSSSPYPNHRSTYSDIKDVSYLEAPKVSSISSITPHLVTTQPINNGKPFVGSRVGNTVLPNQSTTQSKYTYLPTTTTSSKPSVIFGVLRHSSTAEPPPYGPPEVLNVGSTDKSITDLFNTGSTEKTLSFVETSTSVTNALATEIFNVGNTDTTLPANVLSSTVSSTVPPLKIYVPEQGSLNVGQGDTSANNDYQGIEPVNEPPFIKKTIPLLYLDHNATERTVDHATIYGSYPSSTQRSFVSSKNTPYSPTVPTVTQSSSVSTSTSRTPKTFNQGIPVKFDKDQDKISIHLSKNVGGQTRTNDLPRFGSVVQPPLLKVGAVVHVGDVQPLGRSSTTSLPQPSGFFVTKGFSDETPIFSAVSSKSKTEKPRPFSKSVEFEERFNTGNVKDDGQSTITSTFPAYHISSARPFGISETTSPTITTQTPPTFNVYDNVDNMIGVLQEIANFNSQKELVEDARPGLVIPPSVGPQTLHSLAQYFANELQNNGTDNEALEPDTKDKLTTLLTAMTVHGYNNLFNVGVTATPTASTSTVGVDTTDLTPSRFGIEDTNSVGGDSNIPGENSTGDDDGLLSTTSVPELRQLARNFSLALSSYLNDPENFRKSLEGLRPSEPPTLDSSDNVESSTSEDELLNFSDADIKPSTPAVPSPTWGYILSAEANKGTQEDVKNSLNPDLNTADSQSFIPRFNNVQVDEKQGRGFTDLPPNHWTSSPQATKLWQKALSINPAVVNDHFETTISTIALADEEKTEQELFNPDVLPDLAPPHSEISYDLRELPPLALNSTQIHGILIDFMNHTKSDEHNRLNRILKKLNTSEAEFLDRMKEIESNPLTKRLILLLISECGANITQNLGPSAGDHQKGVLSNSNEPLSASASAPTAASRNVEARNLENHSLGQLVHPHLKEDEQDSRAIQLLNSLYTIASRFGKKR